MPSPPRSSWLGFIIALLMLPVWLVVLVVQIGLAWGLRGEPKALWFEVLFYAVYGFPLIWLPLAVASLVWDLLRSSEDADAHKSDKRFQNRLRNSGQKLNADVIRFLHPQEQLIDNTGLTPEQTAEFILAQATRR